MWGAGPDAGGWDLPDRGCSGRCPGPSRCEGPAAGLARPV